VTRHDDELAVLMDDERFVLDASLALTPEELEQHRGPIPPELDEQINTNLLTKDGEGHRRLRRLVTKAFTPRMVEQLRPRIQEIADELLDVVGPRGEMVLVDDYAFPLPITVIAELLGIPSADRDRFREWSNTFVSPPLGEEAFEQFLLHSGEFLAYLEDLFDRRRREPTDDLVTALVQAEEQGDNLSENELFSMVVLLIVAGHETTVSLIGNAVLPLLTHPDELEKIRRTPIDWTSPARTRSTSRSGAVPTSASERRSPGSRPRSPSRPCSHGCPACSWPSHPTRSATGQSHSSAASSRSLSCGPSVGSQAPRSQSSP
jgi:cytochrome P450